MDDIIKIPPHDEELEKAVLSALMIESWVAPAIMDRLNDNSFYKSSHLAIYKAIKELFEEDSPIEMISVAEMLKTKGEFDSMGGAIALAQICNSIGSASNVEYHAHKLTEYQVKRDVINKLTRSIHDAYNPQTDFAEVVTKAQDFINLIADSVYRPSERKLGDVLTDSANQVKYASQRVNSNTFPLYIESLDSVIDVKNGDLIIIAGRPGMAKTSFALDAARKMAKRKTRVGFISLEMKDVDLGKRLIGQHANLNIRDYIYKRGNGYDKTMLDKSALELAEYPLYICEETTLSIQQLSTIAGKWKTKYDIELLMVDYLQLLSSESKKNSNREQEVSHISRNLKKIAMKLNIPVIALSQLSRPADKGSAKRPILTDLRESGSIEQDASMVIFLHRPEYYGELTMPDGSDSKGRCELIIAKQREGESNITVESMFDKYTCRFFDYDRYEEQSPQRLTPLDKAKEIVPF